MAESQNLENKESWRDEYLKWISAFANTQGGKLNIGIDDKGNIIGVRNAKKLLDDVPNKIINHLGLVADVNLHTSNNKEYLEIEISASDVPISYHGAYYVRSGSTTQELRGAALQRIILKKIGKSWDDIPLDRATFDEMDGATIKQFKTLAITNGRLTKEANADDTAQLFENLQLVTEENKLKSAAVLLFAKVPKKYFTTCYVKIGRFGATDHDLRFQDVIEGNLLGMPGKVLDVLKAKYLTSPISYEGIERKEQLEYPEDALREALLNAIVHKDYTGTSVQLSVYDDKLILWNPGTLPDDLQIEDLKKKHPSKPRNKNIAEVFFKAGFIETWGRGISKILDSMRTAGLPDPVFEEVSGGMQVTFFKYFFSSGFLKKFDLNDRQAKALEYIQQHATITNKIYQQLTGTTRITATRDLTDLVEKKFLQSFGYGAGAYYSQY